MKTFQSYSSAETKKFAEAFAKKVINHRSKVISPKHKGALIFALVGDLGSGKTTFVQGFFRGLGMRKRVTSPTFIIMRRVALPRTESLKLKAISYAVHVDCYRIKTPRELLQLGFKEILGNPKNIVLIEWADKIRKILPRGVFWIRFVHGREENFRSIKV